MSSQKPVLNPHQILESHCQGGKWEVNHQTQSCLASNAMPSYPQTFCCNVFIFLVAFLPPWEIKSNWLVQTCLWRAFLQKAHKSTASQAGQPLPETPDQLSRWLWLFLPFAAPSQLDAQEQQPEFSAGARCCVRVSSSTARTASPGKADTGVSAMSHFWRSPLRTFPRFL